MTSSSPANQGPSVSDTRALGRFTARPLPYAACHEAEPGTLDEDVQRAAPGWRKPGARDASSRRSPLLVARRRPGSVEAAPPPHPRDRCSLAPWNQHLGVSPAACIPAETIVDVDVNVKSRKGKPVEAVPCPPPDLLAQPIRGSQGHFTPECRCRGPPRARVPPQRSPRFRQRGRPTHRRPWAQRGREWPCRGHAV